MNTRRLIVIAALVTFSSGCAHPSRRLPSTIHHAVFFTLNQPSDAAELARDCAQLGDIPGVEAWAAGPPISTGRPTVDQSYDLGLYVGFRSASDYQTYISHPIHTRLVEKWKPRWKSLLIRDFGEPP